MLAVTSKAQAQKHPLFLALGKTPGSNSPTFFAPPKPGEKKEEKNKNAEGK